MSTSQMRREIRRAVSQRLREFRLQGPLRASASTKDLTLSIRSTRRNAWFGTLSWTTLRQEDAVYLSVLVSGSPLHDIAKWLDLPAGVRRILADETFVWCSLGDKMNRFSASESGAEPFFFNSDPEVIATKMVSRGLDNYLPIIHESIALDSTLPGRILSMPDYFAYPKIYLGILEAGGVSDDYSRAIHDPRYRRSFKREQAIDMDRVFAILREREHELRATIELAHSHLPSSDSDSN